MVTIVKNPITANANGICKIKLDNSKFAHKQDKLILDLKFRFENFTIFNENKQNDR